MDCVNEDDELLRLEILKLESSLKLQEDVIKILRFENKLLEFKLDLLEEDMSNIERASKS